MPDLEAVARINLHIDAITVQSDDGSLCIHVKPDAIELSSDEGMAVITADGVEGDSPLAKELAKVWQNAEAARVEDNPWISPESITSPEEFMASINLEGTDLVAAQMAARITENQSTIKVGGPSDLWGAPWTPAIVNAPTKALRKQRSRRLDRLRYRKAAMLA